jgi:hypothetical protein
MCVSVGEFSACVSVRVTGAGRVRLHACWMFMFVCVFLGFLCSWRFCVRPFVCGCVFWGVYTLCVCVGGALLCVFFVYVCLSMSVCLRIVLARFLLLLILMIIVRGVIIC